MGGTRAWGASCGFREQIGELAVLAVHGTTAACPAVHTVSDAMLLAQLTLFWHAQVPVCRSSPCVVPRTFQCASLVMLTYGVSCAGWLRLGVRRELARPGIRPAHCCEAP